MRLGKQSPILSAPDMPMSCLTLEKVQAQVQRSHNAVSKQPCQVHLICRPSYTSFLNGQEHSLSKCFCAQNYEVGALRALLNLTGKIWDSGCVIATTPHAANLVHGIKESLQEKLTSAWPRQASHAAFSSLDFLSFLQPI